MQSWVCAQLFSSADMNRDAEVVSIALRILQLIVESRPTDYLIAMFPQIRKCLDHCIPCDRANAVDAFHATVVATLRAAANAERVHAAAPIVSPEVQSA